MHSIHQNEIDRIETTGIPIGVYEMK